MTVRGPHAELRLNTSPADRGVGQAPELIRFRDLGPGWSRRLQQAPPKPFRCLGLDADPHQVALHRAVVGPEGVQ